jgi:FkbM family methyltransferase
MNLGYLLKQWARRLGYDVRKLRGGDALRSRIGESYALMARLGLRPATVIDVGVANGTPELYEAFPQAHFLLVEPLREFEPQLHSILARYRGSYVLAAAGAAAGEAVFNVHPAYLDGSSLYRETAGAAADGYERSIPLVRLDDLIGERALAGPFLIKVDVQGAELEVLRGAEQTLQQAAAVVLEVSLFQFMRGAPELHTVLAFMHERGFVAYDIILGWNRPLDQALGQVDIVFVQEHGPFRQSHAYATPEQIRQIFGAGAIRDA